MTKKKQTVKKKVYKAADKNELPGSAVSENCWDTRLKSKVPFAMILADKIAASEKNR